VGGIRNLQSSIRNPQSAIRYPYSTMRLRNPDALARDPLLARVWEALGRPDGHVTGGFLRDHLLGRPTADLDLTVPGNADDVGPAARRLAADFGTRAHLIGTPPRCIWRIETDALKIDVWPLGPLTLEDDINRRDYSLNALMWRLPSGPMIDLVGGINDVSQRRIRAVSRDNLERDTVRLLRGPRFLSVLDGFRIERRTFGWIRELGPQMAKAPRERVGLELLLLLKGRRALNGLESMIALGLFEAASPPGITPDLGWLKANLRAADRLANPKRHPLPEAVSAAGDAARLGLLMRAWQAPPASTASKYAWPREILRSAARSASLLDQTVSARGGSPADRREFIHGTGEAFPSVVALAAAVYPEVHPEWRRWWRQWRRLGNRLIHASPWLPVAEIAGLAGIGPGPELGMILNDLVLAQVRGDVRTPDGARRWLLERKKLQITN
jgi:tRNA nucleotidyltransferase/poly(A) polymerase